MKSSKNLALLDSIVEKGAGTPAIAINKVGGRPPSTIPRKPKLFNIALDLHAVIDENCGGNQSRFVENILREYFIKNNMLPTKEEAK